MTLSHDIARCPGTAANLCATCRRREPGRPEWQVTILPAVNPTYCPNYIAPLRTWASDSSSTREDETP